MSDTFHTETRTFTRESDGRTFTYRVKHVYDTDHDAPWKSEDGHGPVRQVHSHGGLIEARKRPGEWVLAQSHGTFWLYDFAAALRTAKKEKWSYEGATGTANEIAVEAVRRDFVRLQSWLNNMWHYIGVCVTVTGCVDRDGIGDWPHKFDADESLWGIESDSEASYLREVEDELLEQALAPYDERRKHWRRCDCCQGTGEVRVPTT